MRNAKRQAFNAVAETCPAINKARDVMNEALESALDAFEEIAKTQTTLLREALIEAFEVIGDLEDQLSDAKAEIERLNSEDKP